MLAQSFVSKLLDLKKSSRAFLTFFIFCLFYSAETISIDPVSLLGRSDLSELKEILKKAAILNILLFEEKGFVTQSPIANGRPMFDGPPGNESTLYYVVQSPMTRNRPTFDGPPGNEKAIPSFDPGPPGNE